MAPGIPRAPAASSAVCPEIDPRRSCPAQAATFRRCCAMGSFGWSAGGGQRFQARWRMCSPRCRSLRDGSAGLARAVRRGVGCEFPQRRSAFQLERWLPTGAVCCSAHWPLRYVRRARNLLGWGHPRRTTARASLAAPTLADRNGAATAMPARRSPPLHRRRAAALICAIESKIPPATRAGPGLLREVEHAGWMARSSPMRLARPASSDFAPRAPRTSAPTDRASGLVNCAGPFAAGIWCSRRGSNPRSQPCLFPADHESAIVFRSGSARLRLCLGRDAHGCSFHRPGPCRFRHLRYRAARRQPRRLASVERRFPFPPAWRSARCVSGAGCFQICANRCPAAAPRCCDVRRLGGLLALAALWRGARHGGLGDFIGWGGCWRLLRGSWGGGGAPPGEPTADEEAVGGVSPAGAVHLERPAPGGWWIQLQGRWRPIGELRPCCRAQWRM